MSNDLIPISTFVVGCMINISLDVEGIYNIPY